MHLAKVPNSFMSMLNAARNSPASNTKPSELEENSGSSLHIKPQSWTNFQKGVIEGTVSPFHLQEHSAAEAIGCDDGSDEAVTRFCENRHEKDKPPVPKPRRKRCSSGMLLLHQRRRSSMQFPTVEPGNESSDNEISPPEKPHRQPPEMGQCVAENGAPGTAWAILNNDNEEHREQESATSFLHSASEGDEDLERVLVELERGPDGFGLNIATQESNHNLQKNIFIQHVLPGGPADQDGRLFSGDKLLEVNGEPVSSLSYSQVVSILRHTPDKASLLVERDPQFPWPAIPPPNDFTDEGCAEYIIVSCGGDESQLSQSSSGSSFTKETADIFGYMEESDFKPVAAPRRRRKSRQSSTSSGTEDARANVSGAADHQERLRSSCSSVSVLSDDAQCRTPPPITPRRSLRDKLPNTDSGDLPSPSPSTTGAYLKPIDVSVPSVRLHDYSNTSDQSDPAADRLTPVIVGETVHKETVLETSQGAVRGAESFEIGDDEDVNLSVFDDSKEDDEGEIFEVELEKSSRGLGLGICIEGENPVERIVRIRKLYPMQPAQRCGRLEVGDIVVSVNGTDLSGMTYTEALEALRTVRGLVKLKIFRPPPGVLDDISQDGDSSLSASWNESMFSNRNLDETFILEDEPDRSKINSTFTRHHTFTKDDRQPIPAHFLHRVEDASTLSDDVFRDAQESVSLQSLDVSSQSELTIPASDLPESIERSRRPKSVDIMASTDKKKQESNGGADSNGTALPAATVQRQSSAIAHTDRASNEVVFRDAKSGNPSLLKWRGTTLWDEDDEDGTSVLSNLAALPDGVDVPKAETIKVELTRGWHSKLGFGLRNPDGYNKFQPDAPVIKSVHPGSLADRDGRIKPGDSLLQVNDEKLIGKSSEYAIDYIRKCTGKIRIFLFRIHSST